MPTFLKWLLLIILVSSLAGNAYLGYEYYKNWKDSNSKEEATEEATKTETTEEEKIVDPYEGWKTYINREIGYKLRYPPTWKIEETNTTSELTGQLVKYITIGTKDKKYFLFFGIKKKTDSFAITDRTGVGAGDIKQKGTVKILNTTARTYNLSYLNKIKEIFYGTEPGGYLTTKDGKYEIIANLSYGESSDYDTVDMANINETNLVEKILKSVELL